MSFNSIAFLMFFPVVTCLYFLCPQRWRWAWLLAASYFFYMSWRAEYLLLIVASTLVDYFAALGMGRTTQKRIKRFYLLTSLFFNLGLLFSFKYFNFLNDGLRSVFAGAGGSYPVANFDILLPIGISFYTFQTLSYTIEVYRGRKEPERHLGIFAVYVAFFPQLVAGPIERAQNLLPQFLEAHRFDYDRVVSGLRRMLWGMFKKVVIADRLALLVDTVYQQPRDFPGSALAIATLFFGFQIYCDFSGYSDIAIGAARVLGFDLMRNFRRPYLARSIRDFWSRWHISLSTWFRDYVYIPMGGNRSGARRWPLNILVTFVLSGIWHGANWTFLLWGLLHGLYYLVLRMFQPFWQRGTKAIGLDRVVWLRTGMEILGTYLLVNLSWIFFRANSLGDAWYIVRNLGQGLQQPLVFETATVTGVGMSRMNFLISCGLIALLLAVQVLHEFRVSAKMVSRMKAVCWLRWPVYVGLAMAIMNLGIVENIPFIYFQF